MYSLSALLTSIKDQIQKKPIEIHDIYLGSQIDEDADTLHFVGFYKGLTFFSYVSEAEQYYTPLFINRSAIKKTSKNEIERISYQVDNVSKAMGSYAANNDFRGKRIVTRLLFRDNLESVSDCKIIFDGYIQAIVFGKTSMSASAVPKLGSLDIQSGWDYEINCNAQFGDRYCRIDKNTAANKITGTATGGSLYTLTDTINLVQADDYWNWGILEITSGDNKGQSRKIIDFDFATNQVTLDYAFENYIQAGETYTIYRGCDKTLTTCTNTYANEDNYHGFHSIPLRK